MSLLPVWIVLLSYALVKGCAEAIQCYTCDDCQSVNDTFLQLCPPDAASVADALTSTTGLEELSTISFPGTTTAMVEMTATELVTEAGVNDATEEADPGGDEAEPEPDETEPETEPEPEPAEAETDAEGPEPELASLVLSPDLMSNLNITRRKREATSTPVGFHCFSVERNDGGRMTIKRGCVEVPVIANACAILKEAYGASDQNCRICSQDKCNSGVVSNYSLAAVLLVIVNSLLQW